MWHCTFSVRFDRTPTPGTGCWFECTDFTLWYIPEVLHAKKKSRMKCCLFFFLFFFFLHFCKPRIIWSLYILYASMRVTFTFTLLISAGIHFERWSRWWWHQSWASQRPLLKRAQIEDTEANKMQVTKRQVIKRLPTKRQAQENPRKKKRRKIQELGTKQNATGDNDTGRQTNRRRVKEGLKKTQALKPFIYSNWGHKHRKSQNKTDRKPNL